MEPLNVERKIDKDRSGWSDFDETWLKTLQRQPFCKCISLIRRLNQEKPYLKHLRSLMQPMNVEIH
jgi:hypothetical protein